MVIPLKSAGGVEKIDPTGSGVWKIPLNIKRVGVKSKKVKGGLESGFRGNIEGLEKRLGISRWVGGNRRKNESGIKLGKNGSGGKNGEKNVSG